MKHVFVLLVRLVLGSSFILSGITKILDLVPFIQTVARFNVLPAWAVIPFSVFLPPLELVFGISLLFGYLTRFSSLMIACLIMLMAVAIVPQLLGGSEIGDCGCFGGLMDSRVDINLLLRDMLLFALAFTIFCQKQYIYTFDSYLDKTI